MLMQTPPTPPTPPSLPGEALPAGAPISVNGVPVTNAQSIYQAFRAQRSELSSQLENLENDRQNLTSQLQASDITDADKKGVEQRLASVDARIAEVDKQLATADAQVARAAAIPGAAVDPPSPPRTGPPEEAFVIMGMLVVFGVFPIAIAYARRIWRRSAKIITTIPQELTDRLMRVEQTVESTSIEIERIGEGQRFMTRVLTEGAPMHALGHAGKAEALPVRPGDVRP